VGHAAAAIQLGLCSVAVIAYGSTQRSVSGGLVGIRYFFWISCNLGFDFLCCLNCFLFWFGGSKNIGEGNPCDIFGFCVASAIFYLSCRNFYG
jgi:hypothetical protein